MGKQFVQSCLNFSKSRTYGQAPYAGKVGQQTQKTMEDFKMSLKTQSLAVKVPSVFTQMVDIRKSIIEQQKQEQGPIQEPIFDTKGRKELVDKILFADLFGVTTEEFNRPGCPKVFQKQPEDIELSAREKNYYCKQHDIILNDKVERLRHIRLYHKSVKSNRKNGQIYKCYKDKSMRSMKNQARKALSDEEYAKAKNRPKYAGDVPLKRPILFKGEVVYVVDHFDEINLDEFDRVAKGLMGGEKLRSQDKDNDVDTLEQEAQHASDIAVASLELSVMAFKSIEVDVDTLQMQFAQKLSIIDKVESKHLMEYSADDEGGSEIQLASDGQHPLVPQGGATNMDQTPNWQSMFQTTAVGMAQYQPQVQSGPMFYQINGGNPGVHAHKGVDWQPDSVSAIDMLSGEDQYFAESNVSMD